MRSNSRSQLVSDDVTGPMLVKAIRWILADPEDWRPSEFGEVDRIPSYLIGKLLGLKLSD